MLDVLRRLGDHVLERVVPKAVAPACAGVQVDWEETCFCALHAAQRLGDPAAQALTYRTPALTTASRPS